MTTHRHEFGLIDWIRRQVSQHPRLTLGIGDDTAALRFPYPTNCLITVDMLMEGVHFTCASATPRQIGRKALGVNLSDIAAMAGTPLAAVVSVALPRQGGWELGQGIHTGLQEMADEFEVAVAGGDTNTWDGPLVISVTVLGESTTPIRRSGARAGDWIMATGSFGGSLAGKHLDFTPRVREALILRERAVLHAMLDVSDGLAADLGHILEESSMGAVLDATCIPISPAAASAQGGSLPALSEQGHAGGPAAPALRSPLECALEDGEDFELLFTVSPDDGRQLLATPPFDTPLSHIGEIVPGAGCRIRGPDGSLTPLRLSGWKHGFVPADASREGTAGSGLP